MSYPKHGRENNKAARTFMGKMAAQQQKSRDKGPQPNAYVVPMGNQMFQIIDAVGTKDSDTEIVMSRSELHQRHIPFDKDQATPTEVIFDFKAYKAELTRLPPVQREKGQSPVIQ